MKIFTFLIVALISLTSFNCRENCDEITLSQQYIDQNNLKCNVQKLNKYIVEKRITDSIKLLKLIKINNTIQYYNLSRNDKTYSIFIDNFSMNYYMYIYDRFRFKIDNNFSPYSDYIKMNLYPSKNLTQDDFYVIKDSTSLKSTKERLAK